MKQLKEIRYLDECGLCHRHATGLAVFDDTRYCNGYTYDGRNCFRQVMERKGADHPAWYSCIFYAGDEPKWVVDEWRWHSEPTTEPCMEHVSIKYTYTPKNFVRPLAGTWLPSQNKKDAPFVACIERD